MPTKKSPNGKKYAIDGKTFTWSTSTVDDEPVAVVLPLRVKVKVIRAIAKREDTDVDTMFEMMGLIAPTQVDVMDELDVNDLSAMFVAWQEEYQKLTGATPGE